MPKRFCFKNDSPTFYNLKSHLKDFHFHQSPFNWCAEFNEHHFLFDEKAAEQLEFKHLLAELVQRYCPNVMPLTFCINDTNWPLILNEIATNPSLETKSWILKPSLLNNGEAIRIFQSISEIERHFLSPKRFAGEHVLQLYLKPHLLREHKYSIRMFVVVTNYKGAFLYPKGYFNVARTPFIANDFSDLRCHLTNEHLSHTEANVIQIPTQEFTFFPKIYDDIKNLASAVIAALIKQHPKVFDKVKKPTLAIFGFDFLSDEQQKIWLLEANHGPCFPIDEQHVLQKYLYNDFWHDFIQTFVLPIAKKDYTISPSIFEPL